MQATIYFYYKHNHKVRNLMGSLTVFYLILEHAIHALEMWFNFYLFMLQNFSGGCKYQMEFLMNET